MLFIYVFDFGCGLTRAAAPPWRNSLLKVVLDVDDLFVLTDKCFSLIEPHFVVDFEIT